MKKKIIPCLLATTALIFSLGGTAKATELTSTATIKQVLDPVSQQLNIEEKTVTGKTPITGLLGNIFNKLGAADMPSKYVPSYKDSLTIKNQLVNDATGKVTDTSECWALSFSSAFEVFNHARNLTDKGTVYSARHINLSCNSQFLDQTVTKNRFYRDALTANGGNFYMATTYAAGGRGPVLESDMPSSSYIQKVNYGELNTTNGVQKHLEGYRNYNSIYKYINESGEVEYYNEFKYDGIVTSREDFKALFSRQISNSEMSVFRNTIKNQIMQNGSVTSSIYEADERGDICYDAMINASGEIAAPVHAVLLVGWDDDYQATGWRHPGAYIALNSYGKDNFYDGFVYISYDDFYVEQTLVGITDVSDLDYKYIYQYDDLGCNSTYSLKDNTKELSAVNIFERSTAGEEMITEVGVTSYTQQLVDVFVSDEFGADGKPVNFKLVASDKEVDIGYTIVKLQEGAKLSNNRFAICVKFKAKHEADDAAIAVEVNEELSGNTIMRYAEANPGESYLVYTDSNGGFDCTKEYSWEELYFQDSSGQKYYVSPGIKVFTSNGEQQPASKITSTEYTITNKMITRVPVKTTVETFKTKITVDGDYKIYNKDNEEMTTGLIRTGSKVKVGSDTYEVSVISDVSGAGGAEYSRALDMTKVRSHILQRSGQILTGVNENAADINGNGTITIIDLVKLRALAVE